VATSINGVPIDEATNLPQLPEGHFWKVRKKKETGYSSVDYYRYVYYDGFEVAWMKPNPTGIKWVHGSEKWWKLFQSGHYVPDTEPVAHDKGTVKDYDEEGKEVQATNLTEDLILTTALRVYQRAAESEKTHSLLGSYPPKALSRS
jgi:hypothetical protein